MVFITEQNLVWITVVVLIVLECEYLMRLSRKRQLILLHGDSEMIVLFFCFYRSRPVFPEDASLRDGCDHCGSMLACSVTHRSQSLCTTVPLAVSFMKLGYPVQSPIILQESLWISGTYVYRLNVLSVT